MLFTEDDEWGSFMAHTHHGPNKTIFATKPSANIRATDNNIQPNRRLA
jgi:hypothetical protein